MQGTNYYFITESSNLLKLFSPALVINISIKHLKEVAGKDVTLKRKRKQF